MPDLMTEPTQPRVRYTPLQHRDIDELAAVLHNEAVYRFIGGLPSRDDFERWLRQALAGPPRAATGERWINRVARLAETGEVIGRLEANVHDGVAEVAFLYAPACWGRGFASAGLRWLHDHLRRRSGIHTLWATTHPGNQRSATLLRRCGYVSAPPHGRPVLYSFDEGDWVFTRSLADR
jgi:RimJ/RimL family protein N-acetyltransferase